MLASLEMAVRRDFMTHSLHQSICPQRHAIRQISCKENVLEQHNFGIRGMHIQTNHAHVTIELSSSSSSSARPISPSVFRAKRIHNEKYFITVLERERNEAPQSIKAFSRRARKRWGIESWWHHDGGDEMCVRTGVSCVRVRVISRFRLLAVSVFHQKMHCGARVISIVVQQCLCDSHRASQQQQQQQQQQPEWCYVFHIVPTNFTSGASYRLGVQPQTGRAPISNIDAPPVLWGYQTRVSWEPCTMHFGRNGRCMGPPFLCQIRTTTLAYCCWTGQGACIRSDDQLCCQSNVPWTIGREGGVSEWIFIFYLRETLLDSVSVPLALLFVGWYW